MSKLEKSYTYEEPESEDIMEEEQQQQEEELVQQVSKNKAVTDPWTEAMNSISLENIKKLAAIDTFTVAGQTYKRKMLTPKVRIQLDRLQTELAKERDEEKKMQITEQQALLCLEGMNHDKFENTDIGMLEQVIGACIMAAKGFRKI